MDYTKSALVAITPPLTRVAFWSSLYFLGPITVVSTIGWGALFVTGLVVHTGVIDAIVMITI